MQSVTPPGRILRYASPEFKRQPNCSGPWDPPPLVDHLKMNCPFVLARAMVQQLRKIIINNNYSSALNYIIYDSKQTACHLLH